MSCMCWWTDYVERWRGYLSLFILLIFLFYYFYMAVIFMLWLLSDLFFIFIYFYFFFVIFSFCHIFFFPRRFSGIFFFFFSVIIFFSRNFFFVVIFFFISKVFRSSIFFFFRLNFFFPSNLLVWPARLAGFQPIRHSSVLARMCETSRCVPELEAPLELQYSELNSVVLQWDITCRLFRPGIRSYRWEKGLRVCESMSQ